MFINMCACVHMHSIYVCDSSVYSFSYSLLGLMFKFHYNTHPLVNIFRCIAYFLFTINTSHKISTYQYMHTHTSYTHMLVPTCKHSYTHMHTHTPYTHPHAHSHAPHRGIICNHMDLDLGELCVTLVCLIPPCTFLIVLPKLLINTSFGLHISIGGGEVTCWLNAWMYV